MLTVTMIPTCLVQLQPLLKNYLEIRTHPKAQPKTSIASPPNFTAAKMEAPALDAVSATRSTVTPKVAENM